MLKNFLVTAYRNFVRQKGYTFLNVLGLTIGVTASLFILLYLTHELSFDKHHDKSDRIFRISSHISEPDDAFDWSVTQTPLGPELKQTYPEVEAFVRFIGAGRTIFTYEGKEHIEEKVFFVDSAVFDVFTFNFIAGEKEGALEEPNTVVLQESTAKRIFGEEDPIGKIIRFGEDEKSTAKITGVYKDMPKNSHIRAYAMISQSTIAEPSDPGQWGGFGIYTYILLQTKEAREAFAAKLPEVIAKNVAPIFDQFEIKVVYELLPITDIHLKSDFEGEPEPTGEMSYIYLFGIVGLFMLLIACINYMNLATARSAKRAREVGIRKVLGSQRGQIIRQFLAESVLMALFALVLSVLIIRVFLIPLNNLLGTNLDFNLIFQPQILLSLLGILIITGVLGGSYPAFYLSSFQPVSVLKGSVVKGAGNVFLRKSLVWFQFVISLGLLVCTGIVYDQLKYLQDKDLGFTKDPVVRFTLNGPDNTKQWPVLKEKLLQSPHIVSVGTASSSPGQGFPKLLWNVENNEGVMEQRGVDNYRVDYDYFPALGMEIVAGRNFSQEITTDSFQAVMVNESMARRMGWQESVGKKIQFGTTDSLPFSYVVGVVKDFHQQWLYDPIEPLVFLPRKTNYFAHVRLSKTNIEQSLEHIKASWSGVYSNTPFEYVFLNDEFFAQYEEDQRRGNIFSLFTFLTIVIACLGLLGLASFTAEQRTREIGIRKVVGAREKDIVVLLTKDFVMIIGLAAPAAFLLSWLVMRKWLESFAFHTDLKVLTFAGSLLLTVLITLITTSYQAYRAAKSDPVKAIRYE
ncbi:MAG: ABC transporter permease [Bacteroidia bacterium]|nr:ABC transporter permease [Bacteroidia bacterium]